jgi:NAD(P)-dependent dehydrogenase (short-subunit alcohol dehydrogenase family)
VGALDGKAIVVTGAGRGIGAACALLAAREGAAVVINDLDEKTAMALKRQIDEIGARSVVYAGDISSWSFAADLIDHCVGTFGTIDGLVNNAAVAKLGLTIELEEGDLRAMLDTNVIGSMACLVHASRYMANHGSGSIVNMSSGIQAGAVGLGVYGATKGALSSITYTAALELKDAGVRVNAVSPMASGFMRQRVDEYYMERASQDGRGPQTSRAVTGAGPDPATVAPLVIYLLSDDSKDIAGQIVRINGHELALMTHPAILEPCLENDNWNLDAISVAFQEKLKARAQPLGLVRQRVELAG